MEKEYTEVVNVIPEGKLKTRWYNQQIEYFTRLGKEIKISPKANVSINKAGFKIEFFVDTVNVSIGIGSDHSADLVMSKSAWEALKNGAEIEVITTKEFNEKFL